MLSNYLAERPGDSDASVMQGLILSWEGRYDEARKPLQAVLAREPDYSDAVLALFSVEMWSGNPAQAEQLAREAIERRPGYEPYLEAQSKALARVQSDREAAAPGKAGADWRELSNGPSWQAVVSHSSTFFSDGRSPWREEQIGVRRLTKLGSFLLRASQSNQYGSSSQLVEIDAYPRLRPGTYAYFNLGYSPDHRHYPHYRLGSELFQGVSHGFEVSGGFRLLRFKEKKIQVYTGSITKYKGNWFFSARTFMTPDSQQGSSRSVQFWVRRYLGDGTNYIGTRYGRGASPFEIRSTLQTGVLSSNTFMAEWNWVLLRRLMFNALAGTSKEDRIERKGLGQNFVDITLSFRF
jgi:YaiO family outer membrane protein